MGLFRRLSQYFANKKKYQQLIKSEAQKIEHFCWKIMHLAASNLPVEEYISRHLLESYAFGYSLVTEFYLIYKRLDDDLVMEILRSFSRATKRFMLREYGDQYEDGLSEDELVDLLSCRVEQYHNAIRIDIHNNTLCFNLIETFFENVCTDDELKALSVSSKMNFKISLAVIIDDMITTFK